MQFNKVVYYINKQHNISNHFLFSKFSKCLHYSIYQTENYASKKLCTI